MKEPASHMFVIVTTERDPEICRQHSNITRHRENTKSRKVISEQSEFIHGKVDRVYRCNPGL